MSYLIKWLILSLSLFMYSCDDEQKDIKTNESSLVFLTYSEDSNDKGLNILEINTSNGVFTNKLLT